MVPFARHAGRGRPHPHEHGDAADVVPSLRRVEAIEAKLSDYFTLDAARRELRGEFRTAPRMCFWNTWLNR